jgi:hypothetical protein
MVPDATHKKRILDGAMHHQAAVWCCMATCMRVDMYANETICLILFRLFVFHDQAIYDFLVCFPLMPMHSNHGLSNSSWTSTLAHRLATTTQLYVSKMSFIFWCASINGISIPSSLLLFCPQSFTLVSLPHALWNTIAELQMPCVCSRAKPSARHRESGIGGCKARYPLMLIGNSLWIIQ